MKALAFSPEKRYSAVTQLQDEIRAYQSGFATGAEGAGAWRQLVLLVKRHKMVAGVTLFGLVLLAALSAGYTPAGRRRKESGGAGAEPGRGQ